MIITYETVKFRRPNSDKIELGFQISDTFDRKIIIDTDMNIVLNYSLEAYKCDVSNVAIVDW